MSRTVLAVLALAGAAVVPAGVAHAYPIPPAPPCSFTLSGPVPEGDVVSATVQSAGCAAAAVPYVMVACLQAGDGAATLCNQSRGSDPARVTVPNQPGVAYIATGRGSAGWIGLPPEPNWQVLGPNR